MLENSNEDKNSDGQKQGDHFQLLVLDRPHGLLQQRPQLADKREEFRRKQKRRIHHFDRIEPTTDERRVVTEFLMFNFFFVDFGQILSRRRHVVGHKLWQQKKCTALIRIATHYKSFGFKVYIKTLRMNKHKTNAMKK